MTRSHSRSTSPHDDHRTSKRGRIACVACRQAKVRCDFVTIPCPRCDRLQLDCTVDRTFKRTNKRDKVNELEDNIQRLQDIVQGRQNEDLHHIHLSDKHITPSSLDYHRDTGSISSHHGQSYSSNNNTKQEGSAVASPAILTTVTSHEGRSLGSVSLKYSQIDRLYQIYLEKYHTILPILNASKSATDLFDTSSVLFWTVMCIAARSYQEDPTLLIRLMPMLNTHVWTEFGTNSKSVVSAEAWNISEIQAVLLLAAWPLPNSRFWSDRSLVMSNVAITCGMHAGLHRPGYELDYLRNPPHDLNAAIMMERTSVWVAAYSLCVSLSCEYGHVPLVPQIDWTIKKVCSRNPEIAISKDLRHFAIIERQANETVTAFFQLSENPAQVANEPSFFAHMSRYETAFDDLGAIHLEDMSLFNKVCFYGTLLLLQSMYFLADPSLEETKQGLLRAYSTATTLLNTMILDDTTNDILPCAPQSVLRAVLRSSFAMMRIYFSTFGDSIDKPTCKTLFNTAIFLIRQMSIRPKENDQATRVASALKLSWKRMETDAAQRRPPTLFIRSRLGASLTYDCLVYYREFVKSHNQRPWVDLKNGTALNMPNPSTEVKNQQSFTPPTFTSNISPSMTPGSDDFAAASFESLLGGDLSWMDGLVYPEFYTGEN